jgi:multiple antibiotic resistance protein
MTDLLVTIASAFVTLLIILNPLLSVSLFIDLTRGLAKPEIFKQAGIAAAVAGVLMFAFLIFNDAIFTALGISLASFRVAGGIILFLLGLQTVLGSQAGSPSEKDLQREKTAEISGKSMAGVIIGTPILCGPGAITTVMVIGSDIGIPAAALAICLSLVAIWLLLAFSEYLHILLGDTVIDILSKIMGLLLAAIAVQMIWTGVLGLVSMSTAGLS